MKKPAPTHPIDRVVQRRLDALERVIDDEYEGSPRVLELRTGIRMAQVNQWFSGYRALRDKALRRLEEKTRKPAGFYDAGSAPQPDTSLTPEVQQLLADLDDLPPTRRSRFMDMIHQAAEEAREAADYLAKKAGKTVAAHARVASRRNTASVTWGDGNRRQTSLPLATVADPFTAAPSPEETALYSRFEQAKK